MAVSNNNNNSNSKERTQNIKEVEQKLGENPKITLKGGGKLKSWILNSYASPIA